MKLLILFAISRLCACSLVVPVAYQGVTVGITPYSVPVNYHSQYHAQDKYGQYSYGYATGLSAQDEVKTADGVTRGGYSYIDANGILQTVQYISDPVNGFRVAATNLPKDVPAVAAARAQHLAQFEYIKAEHEAIAASRGDLPVVISPVPAHGGYIVPVKSAGVVVSSPEHFPIAYSPPVVALSSQYQAQDGHGQYSYGYADPNSAKEEIKTADGVTQGGYSYIDANGILQTVRYISDPVNGFRVAATNLPQAPSVTLIGPKVTATVVGPKEPGVVSLQQRPIIVDDIVPNTNIPISVSPGPHIYPNPNNVPVAVSPNPELPPPFYSGNAPTHQQRPVGNLPPVYATSYPVPYPDGGAIVAPVHPSHTLQAPEYHPVPHNHRGQVLIPNQYAPEHRNVYENPNIQVSNEYNLPRTILVDNPREQVLLNPRQYVVPNSDNYHSNLQVTQDQQAQILADIRGQILSHNPHDQIVVNSDPHNQVLVARDQYVDDDRRGNIGREQVLVADHRGPNLGANAHGQIIAANSGAHLSNSNLHGQILADSRGPVLSIDSHGQIVGDPRIHLLNSDSNGQILIADPREQVLSEGHHGQIFADNSGVGQRNGILAVNSYAENQNGQIFSNSQGQVLTADPRGQTFSNNPNGQIYPDQRDGVLNQGQILRTHNLNSPHENVQLANGDYPNGYHPIALSPTSRDYEGNYPINVDTINNAPINQQGLNPGGHVTLFKPDGEAQQVYQGAHVAREHSFVGGQENDAVSGGATPTPHSGYYTSNIQY